MIKLRLFQTGKKHQRQYRIVAMEARTKRQSDYAESLGWYNPRTKELQLNKESVQKWLTNGAQPTETVKNLLIKEGLIK
jgi:small subunit ribosomal protein S16